MPPEAPNGILVEGGRDKKETNWVQHPMLLSHFTLFCIIHCFEDGVKIRFLTAGGKILPVFRRLLSLVSGDIYSYTLGVVEVLHAHLKK